MKCWILMLLLWSCCPQVRANVLYGDTERVRTNYAKAAADKEICKTMIEELSAGNQSALCMAYLGAFKTIWAKHIFNPVAKLSTFNAGKNYLEQAVRKDPDNIEIRFIRLSVQKNCPSFLGYSHHIADDSRFIITNKDKISSAQLKRMLADIL